MKFNILAQPGFNLTVDEIARNISEVGFDGVFLSLNQGHITSEDINIIRKFGLEIETLHLPYNVPFRLIDELWRNGEEKYSAIKILKQGIDFAFNQDIGTVVLHASSGKTPPLITPEGLKNFELIADYCQQKNIILAIENIRRLDYVEILLDNLPESSVKFCFDIGHANAFTHNLYSYNWDSLLKRLHCVHIHDNDGISDLHLIPGMGNIKFDLVISKLLRFNPCLNATLEIYYKGRESFYKELRIKDFFQKAYNAVRGIF